MRAPIFNIKVLNSLSVRLAVLTVLVIALLLVSALSIVFYESRKIVKAQATEKAMQSLDNVLLRMDNTLNKVERAASNMLWNVENHLDQPDMMFVYCQELLENNPDLVSCAIAFEPHFYKDRDEYFIAYAYHPARGNSSKIFLDDVYGNIPYTEHDWYKTPMRLDEPYWVEPFRDYGFAVDGDISTYSLPIHTPDGKVVGILGVDISMDWFSQTIQLTSPFPHSHCTLLGRDGTLLVHPDSTKASHQASFDSAQEQNNMGARKTARSMMLGESGCNNVTLDGIDYIVYFKPFENIGWSVAIVCTEEDIFGSYNRLQNYMVLICSVGMLLLLVFCVLIIHHYLKPLPLLASSARKMSEGRYKDKIPVSTRQDEIGFLQNSFRNMQSSLSNHLSEIQQLTVTLCERNEALKHAYEQGLEADRVKDAFLRNMSNRMTVLMSSIDSTVKKLTLNYDDLQADEVQRLVDLLQSHSEEAAQLLNQLIEMSLKVNEMTALGTTINQERS